MVRWLVVALCLVTASAAWPQAAEGPVGPNLVRNPGFEEVQEGRIADWTGAADVYSSDASVAAEGKRSLRFVNRNPRRYVLFSQSLPLQPGRSYEIRAKVRTRGVVGNDSGATITLEWSDARGHYLGGCYPDGRKGDTPEWTEIRETTPRLPPGAARFTLSCYVRKGMTGEAWWDDVSVRRWRPRPMETLLLSPSYRGWIWGDRPAPARVRVRLAAEDVEGGLDAARVRVRITDATGTVVTEVQRKAQREQVVQTLVPQQGSPYRLTVELLGSSGRRLDVDTYELERRRTQPAVFVDAHNRLIVEGKPFFPLGMYWSGIDEQQLRTYTQGPFNCLMPYHAPDEKELDLLQKYGLKVIYSLKDDYAGTQWCPPTIKSEAEEESVVRGTVRQFRDHPALLAWYLNDERPLSMLPRLEAHQRWVEEEDPNHPTWAVLYQVDDFSRYGKSFDVAGADPYPIPAQPPSLAAQWTRTVHQAVGGARGIWMVPQVFRWPEQPRPPSLAELRSMTWQCIAEGATGLIFYAWFELQDDKKFPFAQRWPEVVQVAREVQHLEPVLLSIEPAPKVKVTGPEALHWTLRAYRGETYVVLVNDNTKPLAATVRWPRAPQRVTQDGKATASGSVMRVHLDSFGVNILRATF